MDPPPCLPTTNTPIGLSPPELGAPKVDSTSTGDSSCLSLHEALTTTTTTTTTTDEDDDQSSLLTEDPLLFEDPTEICRICGKSDGRPVLRFHAVPPDRTVLLTVPDVHTFGHDICLHLFCGRTASILPSVNQPELEILTKAGLKNKHGTGPDVNIALARTRAAVVRENSILKYFYLVREFEAHLGSIRHRPEPTLEAALTRRARIRCVCGGTHVSSAAGRRAHLATKRHIKWMERVC